MVLRNIRKRQDGAMRAAVRRKNVTAAAPRLTATERASVTRQGVIAAAVTSAAWAASRVFVFSTMATGALALQTDSSRSTTTAGWSESSVTTQFSSVTGSVSASRV